jgi:hypothetical protein
MAGFPPIDRLYYENPSIRLGGFLAFVLKHFEDGRPAFNLVPGESRYARAYYQRFSSLDEFSPFLRESHDPNKHCYRGQTKRRRVAYRGAIKRLSEAFPELSPLTITFESLIPSLFRSVLLGDTANWEGCRYPSPLDTIVPAIRAVADSGHEALRRLLADFLMDLRLVAVNNLLIRLGADPRGSLPEQFPLTNVSKKLATLVSLSQHYEFGSCMIDITSNPDVAVWFASHSWSGEPVTLQGQDGVVYRFHADKINKALHKELMAETPAQLAIFATALLGLVDIGCLPEAFGLRPRRQYGGSIMGLENSVAMYIMDVYEAIETFTFPLSTVTGKETALTKEDLAPPDDPVASVFNPQYRHDVTPLTADELARLAKGLGLSQDDAGVLYRARSEHLI